MTKSQFHLQMDTIISELDTLLSSVCSSHGLDHAKAVLYHVQMALKDTQVPIDLQQSIELAALLHDADDHKLFKTTNYENARHLMRNIPQIIVNQAIEMISLVSCSQNGDSTHENPYYLYPRYADRLEAIGKIGLLRCMTYCNTIQSPLYTENTPRYTTIEELRVTKQRYLAYKGKSESMVDHCYDKLLHLADFESDNSYFNEIKNERMAPIYKLVFLYGKKGFITKQDVLEICE
eukprot:NODE_382_length_8372_cov_0.676538.p4 type:complete len:235 gc:universal NODE_382_length_8372_cov_0.676538:1637-933(-)